MNRESAGKILGFIVAAAAAALSGSAASSGSNLENRVGALEFNVGAIQADVHKLVIRGEGR